MKKFIKLLCVLSLAVGLVACSGSDDGTASEPNKEFDEYVENLPSELYSATDYGLNYTFVDKEAAGYKDELYEYTLPSRDEYDESVEEMDKIYDEIKDFSRSSLSKDQQLTYDVMLAYFDTSTDMSDDAAYYLNTNYLDTMYGAPSNMPLNFYFYKFRTQSDVDSYLNLLKTTKDYYEALADHEQDRQDAGYGMTPSQITALTEQCTDYIDGDQTFLIDSFNEKIDGLDGLSDAEKEEYKATNKKYVEEDLKQAYTSLKEKVEAIDVKTKKDEGYAVVYDDGKEYYEELISANTGFETVEEYREYLEEKQTDILSDAQAMMMKDSTLIDRVMDDAGNDVIDYTDATNPTEVLNELKDEMSDDFPEIRELEYDMEIVPESMQSIFEASAAYFISPVDSLDSAELMVLNSEYSEDSYLTIAHEGFPGHMYQTQYYKEQDQPIIRQLMDFDGYTEGYANYVENYSAKYANDADAATLYTYLMQYTYIEILLLDVEIHYDGISKDDAVSALASMGYTNDVATSQYEQLLHSPGVFSKYYGAGFRFKDLREKVQEENSDVTDKEYHEAILNVGSAPYSIVEDYVMNELVGE